MHNLPPNVSASNMAPYPLFAAVGPAAPAYATPQPMPQGAPMFWQPPPQELVAVEYAHHHHHHHFAAQQAALAAGYNPWQFATDVAPVMHAPPGAFVFAPPTVGAHFGAPAPAYIHQQDAAILLAPPTPVYATQPMLLQQPLAMQAPPGLVHSPATLNLQQQQQTTHSTVGAGLRRGAMPSTTSAARPRNAPSAPAPPPPFVITAPPAGFVASGAEGAPPLHFSPTRQKRSNRPILIPPPAEGEGEPRQLRISYLPTMVTEKGLVELFSPFPGYQASRVAVDASTGRALGVGFLWFESQEAALTAIQAASGRVLLGKRLRLRFETPQVRFEEYDALAPVVTPGGDSGDDEIAPSSCPPAEVRATPE